MQGHKIMEALIDKLCDHLSPDRIKLFIENGFDEWETITYMKGTELVELHFTPEECIIVMVAVNSTAKEVEQKEIFNEEAMQKVLALAKENQKVQQEKIMLEEAEHKIKEISLKQEHKFQPEEIVQYPAKPITQAILQKGVTLKGKQKVPLNKITLISLEQKELTHIAEMDKVLHIQNLHLGHNHIYRLENLLMLHKLKVLKIEGNQICKIQGLEGLQNLQQLFINDNHISKLQGLTNNRKLHYININHQKTKRPLTFDQITCDALGYTLETMLCDDNRVQNITNLKHLKVINTLNMKNNNISDMGELSEPLGSMERLKMLDFRGNPLASLPKYRDYIVILSKNLQQLDTKKILPTQRQYLVKLYSLKHAKQMRDEGQGSKKMIQNKGEMNIQVTKLQQGQGQYMHSGSDLRGNVAYANTKVYKK